ncbi:hydroxymethylbilane synthase [Methyloceanibacter caenitepidi]|uniref:hydroxymethylbilane synthase n=1 Tax=Methyloceanibacter caenitepidi TaxID=1384459 RepID=UPI0009E425AC|nr:hydroxymethylbilane synthase [Methyloceanibacter caenitepidi]
MPASLPIGTRGSPLALWQAEHVRDRLAAHHGPDRGAASLSVITTSGDRIQDKPLADFGGKGLFTKEIDEALLRGDIALAVHSMKDLPTQLPDGLCLAAVLPRADVRDAFLSPSAASLAALPAGAVVGTSSLRRGAQVKRARPDVRVVDFRGNVQTRMRKLAEGVADATLLAKAGLDRLGLADAATSVLSVDEMLPAVAQGAIGVVTRCDDDETRALLQPLNDSATETAVTCERAFLAELDGSCRTPIAGLAAVEGDTIRFRGLILSPDGAEWHEVEMTGPVAEAEAIGHRAGEDVRGRAGPAFLDKMT